MFPLGYPGFYRHAIILDDAKWNTVEIINLYYNYEKYPLSPLKPRFLVLIEQYLPNISDPVYSVHQS